jgi:hypothetical protein
LDTRLWRSVLTRAARLLALPAETTQQLAPVVALLAPINVEIEAADARLIAYGKESPSTPSFEFRTTLLRLPAPKPTARGSAHR